MNAIPKLKRLAAAADEKHHILQLNVSIATCFHPRGCYAYK